MEKSIIAIDDFNSINLITHDHGYPSPEEVKATIENALAGFDEKMISLTEHCFQHDDEEYRLFLIADTTERVTVSELQELEAFEETLEAAVAEEGWYSDQVEESVEDVVNDIIIGNAEDEEIEEEGDDDDDYFDDDDEAEEE